jgi:hypothetical protein
MNKKLLTVLVGATLAGATGAAHAIEAKVSGQVARALMFVDDGKTEEVHHVDAADKTRFRFTGTGEIMPGLTGGLAFEAEFVSNGSSAVTNFAKSVAPSLAERHMHVWLGGAFGRVSLGQSDGAANGASEVDLSGTGVFASMTISDWGGALPFCSATDTAAAACSGPTVGSSLSNQDFESRYDRIRYDTPALGPVKISVSSGVKGARNDAHEAAVWYAGDLGAAGKLEAALGYSKLDVNGGNDTETVGGSVSWLLPMGLNFTLGYTEKDIGQNATTLVDIDGEWTYAKVGFKTGKHAVAVEFSKGEDQGNIQGREAELVGLAYVYKPVAWAELFAGYRQYSLDQPGNTYEDIDLVAAGVYFKF